MKKENILNTNKPFIAQPVLALFGPVTAEMARGIADILAKYEEPIMCVSAKDTEGGEMLDDLGATVIFSVITK